MGKDLNHTLTLLYHKRRATEMLSESCYSIIITAFFKKILTSKSKASTFYGLMFKL
jgi:hypothetical protein